MKKCNKWLSVLLVLALALGLLGGMPVRAEEGDADDLPGEPMALTAEEENPEEEKETGDTDSESPKYAGKVELISYEVSPSYIEKGQYFSLGLDIVDNRLEDLAIGTDVKEAVVTVNSTAFSFRSASAKLESKHYHIQFGDILYMGGTPTMTLEISYPGSEVPIYRDLTITLNQCYDTPDPTPTPEPVPTPEPTYKTPGIIIKQSSFGDSPQVQAGAEFTLTLTVFTTTGTENLTDVLVELSLPKDVSLATGNLNTYIGEMGPEATRTVTYQILPSATFVDGVANIGVSMSGIGQNTGSSTSGSTSISVPVIQPERFEITNIEAPEMMMLGEEGYVSVTFVNKGKTPINNLSAEIMGDNLANPGQSQFLGNIAAGTENSVDFDVMASAAGVINATVVLSYEDEAGNIKTLQKTFSCTVEEMPMFEDPGFYDPAFDMGDFEEPKAGMPWWGWVLILLAVGGAAAAVVVVLKKRKAKKALAELEDQDEDI